MSAYITSQYMAKKETQENFPKICPTQSSERLSLCNLIQQMNLLREQSAFRPRELLILGRVPRRQLHIKSNRHAQREAQCQMTNGHNGYMNILGERELTNNELN